MATITLLPEFGYVICTGIASAFFLQYLGGVVTGARSKLGVPYPSMYADAAEARVDKNKYLFNCYQRAHQNTLEQYPVYLMLLFLGGLKHPVISAGAGVAWIVGRFMYAQGYMTGDPSKRMNGVLQYPAVLTLLGCTVSTTLSILKVL